MDVESFKKRVDRAIDMVKSSNRSQGVDEILVPGEPEARTEKQQLETGIKYPIELVDKLRELSSRLKVSVPF